MYKISIKTAICYNELMRISYSAYDTYKKCPLKYKFSYIDKISAPKRPELFFGGLIHSVVQYALKKDPLMPSYEELIKFYEENWESSLYKDKDQEKQYFDFGKNMIFHFHGTHKPGLRDIIATEKYFAIPLSEKHQLSGVIDRVDKLPIGAIEIIDYKTNKSLPTQQDIDNDFQMNFYQLAVKSLWPEIDKVKLTFYFLKPNVQMSTTRDDYAIDMAKKEIIATADTITSQKDFCATPNRFCDWCDFQNRCPAFADLKTSDDRESKIIEKFLAAKKAIDVLEPEINKIMNKSGKDVLKSGQIRIYRDKENDNKLSIRD